MTTPKVYFAFHYQRDIWRVNVVRKSHVIKGVEEAGFIDASLWEEAKKKGDLAIKKMIDEAMTKTAVTAVLIGAQTADRKYVDYEIRQSKKLKKGLIGIYIHKIEGQDGREDEKGQNPITKLGFRNIPTYDWVRDDGFNNMGKWVEQAYQVRLERPTTGRVTAAGTGAAIGALGGPLGVAVGAAIGYLIGDEIDE